ncbi:MAG: dephospho-CoA kinase [Gemmataceae bacterium]|nr:dephospho-CoA kinase [Gemmataceae bacterium]
MVGGIGSGKSLVAAEFARRGGSLIVADKLGHEGLRAPDVKERVVQRWGKKLLDLEGEIDRKKLGAIVFADPKELRELEKIVFPFIGRRIHEQIDKANRDEAAAFIVLDAAVMVEAGWDRHCDLVVFVEAARSIRLARVCKQRGWNEQDVAAREQAQMPLEEKRRRAHAVLTNEGKPEELARPIEALLERLRIL